jgi:hypothetical protein
MLDPHIETFVRQYTKIGRQSYPKLYPNPICLSPYTQCRPMTLKCHYEKTGKNFID